MGCLKKRTFETCTCTKNNFKNLDLDPSEYVSCSVGQRVDNKYLKGHTGTMTFHVRDRLSLMVVDSEVEQLSLPEQPETQCVYRPMDILVQFT